MTSGAWAQDLERLRVQGTITGYVLCSVSGVCEPAAGRFLDDCAPGGPVPAAYHPFISPFFTTLPPPTAYELWGRKLQTIHRDDTCLYTISRQRCLGIAALHLPVGVLLVSFDGRVFPQAVRAHLEHCCARGVAA